MKMRHFNFFCFTAGCLLIFSSSLMAFGIGIYGTGNKGSNTWTYHINEIPDFDIDSDITKLGGGLVLDSNLAYDTLFNYRLNVGYAKISIDNEKNNTDVDGKEYHLYNSFGFGVFRSELVRIWFGPQIGLGVINGKYDLPSSYSGDNGFFTFFLAAGVVAGINFNIGDIFTIAMDGGYRFNQHWGTGDMGGNSIGITGKGKEGFANVSLIFRIGDTF